MAETQWERLARYVKRRRLDLEFNQGDKGPSSAIWGHIEGAKKDRYSDKTVAGVCKALQWTSGSIDLILDGGEPVELPADARPTVTRGRAEELRSALHQLVDELVDLKSHPS